MVRGHPVAIKRRGTASRQSISSSISLLLCQSQRSLQRNGRNRLCSCPASERTNAAASGEMVCGVCLNHCNYESEESGSSMYVWEDFENAGVVPCNQRVRFNNMTREMVTFVANQLTCTVKHYKGRT